jgi:hypothetical protein
MPCRVHAVPLPFSDSALSFVKVRLKYPNCYSYSLTDWYASDNNLRGNPRDSRKQQNEGRSPTCRPWTADVNSHTPCHAHAALCRGLEKSLSERHGRGMAQARHGMGVAWYL